MTASRSIVWLLAAVSLVGSAHAHQVPRAEYDRNVTVTVRADAVLIRYRLEVDEFTLLRLVGDPANRFPLDPNKRIGRQDMADAFVARMKEVIPDQLLASIDDQPLSFTCSAIKPNFLDSVQFQFTLKAPLALKPGSHSLEIEDLNFADKKGRLSIKVEVEEPLKPESITEIAERRSTGLMDQRALAAAKFVAPTAPIVEPPTPPTIEPGEPPAEPEPETFWQLLRRAQQEENLAVLLDSKLGLAAILLIAFMHGVMHSIAPGHGKTMVAAYLIGEQGTPRHAVVLGLVVTLTHTSAAFAVALLLKFVWADAPPETVQRILSLAGGALVAFVGLWLLMQRLRGDGHGHSHAHGHGHAHSHGSDDGHGHSHGVTPEQFARVGWFRLILLGISGGVVPCWGAVLWVLYCVTAGRYGLATWTVLSFSFGLAIVLILLGLSVVWGARAGSSRFAGKGWFRYVAKWLPIVGAIAVIAIGLWLCRMNWPK